MKRLALIGLAPFLLGACVTVLPEQVTPEGLYRLRPAPEDAGATPVNLPVNITVYEPEGSTLLLGSSIIFETGDGALSLMKQSQWSDTSSGQLQSLMLERLALTTPDSAGIALSDQSGALTPAELRWQVKDFVVRDGVAIASFRVTVMAARRRQILGQFDVTKEVGYTGKANIEGVQALIKASRGAVDQIALKLPEVMSQIELIAESKRR